MLRWKRCNPRPLCQTEIGTVTAVNTHLNFTLTQTQINMCCCLKDTGRYLYILLVLLRSPAISQGFTILGEISACVTISNPTIEVVTFRLRGWCNLGEISVYVIISNPTNEVVTFHLRGWCILDEISACVTLSNPTIEVVTFHLHGWCMPPFIHTGHECQDLLSPCNEMHVCTD